MKQTSVKTPGLFKRAVALLIDSVVALSVGCILTWPFSGYFSKNPSAPILLTWLSLALYSGFLESNLTKHNSLGKSFLGMKVVSSSGIPPTFLTAFTRRFFMLIPFYNELIGSTFPFTNPALQGFTHPLFFLVLSALVIGITIHAFFHPQKRSLHDLLFKTHVCFKENTSPIELLSWTKKSSLPSAATFFICLVSIVYLVVNNDALTESSGLDNFTKARDAIIKETGESSTFVGWTSFSISGGKTTTWIKVNLTISEENYENEIYKNNFITKSISAINSFIDTKKYQDIRFTFTRVKYFGLLRVSNGSTETYSFTGQPL